MTDGAHRGASALANNDVLDLLPAPVIAFDREGRVRVWNASAERQLGWARDEVLGRHLPEAASSELDEHTLEEAFARGGLDGLEVHVRAKNGALHALAVHARRVFDDLLLCVAVDMTERRAGEERVRAASTLEALGQITSGVAHDLNNMLTAVLANVGLVQSIEGVPLAALDAATEIGVAADHGAALIRQLLAFSRSQYAERAELDVNTVVAPLERFFRRVIRPDIALHFDLAERLPTVLAEPTGLEQVVFNLVLNARDAIPSKGTIRIATATRNGHVEIAVEDDGVGIRADVRDRLFEPFVTTKAAGRGTGLGLANVQRIIAAAGGSVTAHDREPHGARFVVSLPVHGATRIATVPPPARGAVRSAPRAPRADRVLFVENDVAVRAAGAAVLKRFGYRVRAVGTIGDAVSEAYLADEPFAVAVVDLVLPDGNGRALAELLQVEDPNLVVLFTSGGVAFEQRPDGALLTKPYDAMSLAMRVRELLDQRS